MSITMTSWISGDRMFRMQETPDCGVPVTAGHQYNLHVQYTSTTPSAAVSLFRHTSEGWSYWQDMGALPPTASYRQFAVLSPVIPAGTDMISWGGSIYGVGTLVEDNFSVYDVNSTPTGPTCATPVKCTVGSWELQPYLSTVKAVHSVLLYTGKILLIEGSGNDAQSFAAGSFTSTLYDPVAGTFTPLVTPDDLFCGGHVQLSDGRVLVMGGTAAYPAADGSHGFLGEQRSYVFDPATNAYTQVDNLLDGHWYPSATEMGNGDVITVGGLRGTGLNIQSTTTERWSEASQMWLPRAQTVQTNREWSSYPTMLLMQDGRLFYTGSHLGGVPDATGSEIYDYDTGTRTDVPGLQTRAQMDHSMSVLLPPAQDQMAMTMGGLQNGMPVDANRLTNIIDLKAPDPHWVPGPPLPLGTLVKTGVKETGNQGKAYVSAVLLPDGKVFETGGALHDRADDVAEASMFDPATRAFTSMSTDPVGRDYHSSASLLPDGRVIALGSNPANGRFEMRITVYSPPYLFQGRRPTITDVVSRQWDYGSSQSITVDSPVVRASLIRPAAVTHSSDPNQRYIDLPITNLGHVISLNLTTNPNVAPPGWYMLFVADANGTPSVAKWVHVG